jgi:hypothetical protein
MDGCLDQARFLKIVFDGRCIDRIEYCHNHSALSEFERSARFWCGLLWSIQDAHCLSLVFERQPVAASTEHPPMVIDRDEWSIAGFVDIRIVECDGPQLFEPYQTLFRG